MSLTARPSPRASYVENWDGKPLENVGRIVFVPPGVAMLGGCLAGQDRAFRCEIAQDMFEDYMRWKPVWTEGALKEGLHLRNPKIEQVLKSMVQELEFPDFGSERLLGALTVALCVELARHFEQQMTHRAGRLGGLAPWRLRLIQSRVETEANPPSVKELADMCGLTVRHLTRAFLEETGQTVGEFTKSVTMKRARTLLESTNLAVAEIAAMLGYSSCASFSHAYVRYTGARPSDVRLAAGLAGADWAA